jgi:hypothetical protein
MRNSSELSCIFTVSGVLTGMVVHSQFLHMYGQQGARLDWHRSIHGSITHPRTLIFTIFSPFCFWTPEDYLKEFERVWVDRQIRPEPWIQYLNKLDTESQEYTLIVLLFRICA